MSDVTSDQYARKIMNFILGKKLNMSQYFAESGEVVPVTVVKISPMTVTQIKTSEGKDKYTAVQIGVGKAIGGTKNQSKAVLGHLKNEKFSLITEFRTDSTEGLEVGSKIDASGFQVGELVNAIGTMKGRGFAGVMKRHGFAGFPASHGHDKPRSVGSIGQRYPQHVRKGLRMAGRMGGQQVTVKNLQIVEIDNNKGLLMIKGAVPGHRNGIVRIISTGKVKPVVKIIVDKDDKKKK